MKLCHEEQEYMFVLAAQVYVNKPFIQCLTLCTFFHQLGPLGQVGLVVVMSVCLSVCLYVVLRHRVQFFLASHWPSGHMSSRSRSRSPVEP
jgi:hypothetical protein